MINIFFVREMTVFFIVIYAMIYLSLNHSYLINKIQKIPSAIARGDKKFDNYLSILQYSTN
ncbi:hypothetical protein XNC1_1292 [Xenorhabdus nematophila ATCC 19061]|uniref:Uncharacterized protein n=1 Tax=Xenorhabdus nematophila (strain ATCC 19061 / DSM 3370 / CCUG 14189 / LMG 1036 / NCIMB 9965 / AN6) TaxID=406817 RepID=D3V9W9_XENNA|nr:hypothetical protein XNC1_1292 [Xenorhabdus nematophila ATCC 19061]